MNSPHPVHVWIATLASSVVLTQCAVQTIIHVSARKKSTMSKHPVSRRLCRDIWLLFVCGGVCGSLFVGVIMLPPPVSLWRAVAAGVLLPWAVLGFGGIAGLAAAVRVRTYELEEKAEALNRQEIMRLRKRVRDLEKQW